LELAISKGKYRRPKTTLTMTLKEVVLMVCGPRIRKSHDANFLPGAPECCRTDDILWKSNIEVKQNVDVWSLGAVFSEAAVWLVENFEGVDEYRRARRAATREYPSFEDSDCFHDGEKMLDVVRQWHRRLPEKFRSYDVITSPVLTMVEDMLMDAPSRANTNFFWRKSQNLLREARSNLAEKQDSKTSSTPKKLPPPPVASQSSTSSSPTSTISEEVSPMYESMDDRQRGFSRYSAAPLLHRDVIAEALEEEGDQVPNQGFEPTGSLRLNRHNSQQRRQMSQEYPGLINRFATTGLDPTPVSRSSTHQTTRSAPVNEAWQHGYQENYGDHHSKRHQVNSMPPISRRNITLDDVFRNGPYHDDQAQMSGAFGGGAEGYSRSPYPEAIFNPQGQDITANMRARPPNAFSSPPTVTPTVPYPGGAPRYLNQPASETMHQQSHTAWTPPILSSAPQNAPYPYQRAGPREAEAGESALRLRVSSGQDGGQKSGTNSSTEPSSQVTKSTTQDSSTEPVPEPKFIPNLSVGAAITWKENKKKGKSYPLVGEWLFDRLKQRDHVCATPAT
jgi:hypothetical protein